MSRGVGRQLHACVADGEPCVVSRSKLRALRSGRVRLVSSDPDVPDITGDLAPVGDLRVVAQLVDVFPVET